MRAEPRREHRHAGRGRAVRGRTPTPGPRRVAVERGDVTLLQRARIVSAMVEVVAERGLTGSTVAHVVAHSGVSRRTFYELFADREDCFLAAFDQAMERGAARVVPAFEAEGGGWLTRVRAGLRASLEFLDDEPGFGRLAIVDSLGAGPTALSRRAGVVGVLVDAVDQGRREPNAARGLTRLTAEGVVGAVLAIVHARLVDAEPEPTVGLVGLLGPLMGLIVLPYRGRAAAEREAARPAPSHRPPTAQLAADPLRGLEMRLTYRTLSVLAAIAALGEQGSDPSNREVADAAGVADPGQISRLLVRLEHLGLVVNVGRGHARGEPNAWQLTGRGRQVERAIDLQADLTQHVQLSKRTGGVR
jgi:AcrR family transcriptional regulator